VGIKGLVDYSKLPAADRSFHDVTIENNVVSGFNEEGISFDANGNTDVDSTVQGTGVATIQASAKTVTLGSGWTNLGNAPGAWLSFNTGGAAGRYVQIAAVNATTRVVTVTDPNGYLAAAGSSAEISITSPYRNNVMLNNTIDETGSFTGIDFTGPTFACRAQGNVITGTPARRYPASFHLRTTASGTAFQSIRHTSLWDMPTGSMTAGSKHGATAYNSIVGNTVSYDVSFSTRGTSSAVHATYQAGNTSQNGQVYKDGSYTYLATDPN
jgi:hypothetical protein